MDLTYKGKALKDLTLDEQAALIHNLRASRRSGSSKKAKPNTTVKQEDRIQQLLDLTIGLSPKEAIAKLIELRKNS